MTKILKDNVQNILTELKNLKLVDTSIYAKPSNQTINFQSSPSDNNRINYNPAFNVLSEDSIRFILLHEVGHKHKFQWARVAIITSLICFAVTYYIIFLKILLLLKSWNIHILISHTLSTLMALIIAFSFFIVTNRLFIPLLRKDELAADTFAASMLIKGYPGKKPSEIFKTLFKSEKAPEIKSKLRRRLSILLYKLIKYHPTNEQRIENMKEIEQSLYNEKD